MPNEKLRQELTRRALAQHEAARLEKAQAEAWRAVSAAAHGSGDGRTDPISVIQMQRARLRREFPDCDH